MTYDNLLTSYQPITLEEMSGIRLMNRIDTKFVTTEGRLRELLAMARDEYFVQQTEGARCMHYETTYFDTDDFDMYNMHQAGHAGRQKLRFRTYVDSHLQFMEVKTKNNHGRTKKKRLPVEDMSLDDNTKQSFLNQHLHYDVHSLTPSLANRFNRVTLVNRARTERLTIDTNLCFSHLRSGKAIDMGPLVVVELKRDGLCPSPVLAMLRQLRIMPHGFSKYCMGSALTHPGLRVNRFKLKLIEINKLLRTEGTT